MTYSVALLGDVVFGDPYSVSNPGVFDVMAPMAEHLAGFDLVVGNLEGAFVTPTTTYIPKAIHIGMKPEDAELLGFLNIGLVTLANNHAYDYGDSGLKETLKVLRREGVDVYGVDGKPFFIDNEDAKLAFSGYCCLSANPPLFSARRIRTLNPKKVMEELINLGNNGYYNIASFHWGDENTTKIRPEFQKFTADLAQKTEVCIHGHHPHISQLVENFDESVIAYSLGNFCMPNLVSNTVANMQVEQKEHNNRSFVLELNFDKKKLISLKVRPKNYRAKLL
ncbi:CapA family protein [bacterium]|nr:CapA family protein [bacterium]